MEALNQIFPNCAAFFFFGFALMMGTGFVTGGIVGVVKFIFKMMGGN